ncbi:MULTISPECIES: hypothetical protein [unclassified Actinobaculum]|uniref:hypothetical protein n=1 Tax=unclassified Actinobaculum TaxID=2609299 RepID=UPI000D529722|nr:MULTISPECIES: hypothetical protein [unclassified Actinobaculum]AWE41827.1 hypothetical protein DDD63_02580 [Actinobaculum sp. 313]RTE50252.1 hypothetical protein EKN07_03320 [Actinobaculum sp. 352]
MFKRLAAAIASIGLILLSACGTQSTGNSTSPSEIHPIGPAIIEYYEDAADLRVGTVVTMTVLLESFDEDIATLCLDVGESHPPVCTGSRFIALNIPFDEISWDTELTQQRPRYRSTFVTVTGTLVYPGVIEVSEIEPLS